MPAAVGKIFRTLASHASAERLVERDQVRLFGQSNGDPRAALEERPLGDQHAEIAVDPRFVSRVRKPIGLFERATRDACASRCSTSVERSVRPSLTSAKATWIAFS